MPNRIIKESICTSETIDKLSFFDEICFYRLIVNCDDFGIMDARPKILKARLFPLKSIELKEIETMLNNLSNAGLISLYTVEDIPYLQLVKWSKHQQIRNIKSKYPQKKQELILNEINCIQDNSNDLLIQSNPIQSEIESESISESELCNSIIKYLNQRTGKSYKKTNKTTIDLIKSLLEEGYNLKDFKTVIDNKCNDWIGTNMEMYLRPSTLFGEKFEGYLNEKNKNKEKSFETDDFFRASLKRSYPELKEKGEENNEV